MAPACPNQERLEILGIVNGGSALAVANLPLAKSGLVTPNHTFIFHSGKRALGRSNRPLAECGIQRNPVLCFQVVKISVYRSAAVGDG